MWLNGIKINMIPKGKPMYLARKLINKQTRYYIRESYQDGSCLKSRDVFDLGFDPSAYIVYPGGNGYYYDEQVEAALEKFGLYPTQDELDHIFWGFLDPEIRRVITGFQRNFHDKNTRASKNPHQAYHLFDKRRIHYLRFGRMDQQGIENVPDKLFRALNGKSRDEIEQYFLVQERVLAPRELKRYVYTIFDLKQVALQVAAARMPLDLSWEKMDDCFIRRICRLNDDETFWSGMPVASGRLRAYLIKYAVMYFDQEFLAHSPFQAYLNDFRNRHRGYRPPEKVRRNMAEAARLFETTWEVLKKMDRKAFMRLYRKQALKYHPDQGGDQETFVRLTRLYEGMLKKKRNKC